MPSITKSMLLTGQSKKDMSPATFHTTHATQSPFRTTRSWRTNGEAVRLRAQWNYDLDPGKELRTISVQYPHICTISRQYSYDIRSVYPPYVLTVSVWYLYGVCAESSEFRTPGIRDVRIPSLYMCVYADVSVTVVVGLILRAGGASP